MGGRVSPSLYHPLTQSHDDRQPLPPLFCTDVQGIAYAGGEGVDLASTLFFQQGAGNCWGGGRLKSWGQPNTAGLSQNFLGTESSSWKGGGASKVVQNGVFRSLVGFASNLG